MPTIAAKWTPFDKTKSKAPQASGADAAHVAEKWSVAGPVGGESTGHRNESDLEHGAEKWSLAGSIGGESTGHRNESDLAHRVEKWSLRSLPPPNSGVPKELEVSISADGAMEATVSTAAGLATLATGLAEKGAAELRSLTLSGKQGSDVRYGWQVTDALATAYSVQSLQSLSIRNCEIVSADAAALAVALRKHRALTQLELWNVQLEDDGALAVAGLCDTVETLTELQLGRNPFISAECKSKVVAMVDPARVKVRIN